jgi:uncharacterized protein YndB with AHSA1/START domain
MAIDVHRHLGAVERSVEAFERDGKPVRAVVLRRGYDTDIEDLWDALTNAERIPRWFMPVEGDLKQGGRYQLIGNAGGTITSCAPPAALALTWEMRGQVSWVEVQLRPESPERTRLTLRHIAEVTPEGEQFWDQFGPGAVGVGWEGGLLGMALYLANPTADKIDENTFATTPEGRAFFSDSAARWGDAAIAAGQGEEAARTAARNTAAFYTGQPPADAGA